MAKVIECNPNQLQEWIEEGSAILIDVREVTELTEARIPGALHLPLSQFDPEQLPQSDGKRIAFLCAHGIRSQQVSEYLVHNGLLNEAFNVTGGVAAWLQAGLPHE